MARRVINPPWLLRLATAAVMTAAAPTWAATPGGLDDQSNTVSYAPAPAERRDGFTFGLELELGMSNFRGYPNEVAKLDDAEFLESTGAGFGNGVSFWFGGALRDWLSVGLGAAISSSLGQTRVAGSNAALIHVEAFPLFHMGGPYQDLGLGFDGGVGFAQIFDANGAPGEEEPLADGGIMSYLSWSAFYEPWTFWHCSTGPAVSFTHSFSQSMSVNQVLAGWRLSFYGVQPSPPRGASHQ